MLEYNGIYRGTVVYNIDPDVKGKCKIFVHGIYPDEYLEQWELLPWAEPAMAIGGGAWTNENVGLNKETGWCSPPHMAKGADDGAQVFVFFEAGNINKPVYFAAAQSGPGWFSEHPNQHVFHSDNIRVRIDEEPEHPDSTCKFDTYNDQNSDPSKEDGTKLNRKTRLDIEVLAKDINAVNIQIHGDVNMKIDGDWYVHHEGNKHETHIGDTYIKHIGATYTEEEGPTIFRHVGDYHRLIDGSYNNTITANYNKTIGADSCVTITNRSTLTIGGDYNKTVGGSVKYDIVGGENKSIIESKTLKVGGDSSEYVIGEKTVIVDKNYIMSINENIEEISKQGNITLTTQGEFEILDENGNITAEGYNNLGTKGNITITSTFGNIGINTIENKALANLETETCVIPWNPGYLKSLALISQLMPGFDPNMIVKPLTPPTDLTSFLQMLKDAVLYDGFPTFLPCKMIMQNPSIETPSSGWISKFRSIDDNWTNVTNTNYWKLISRVVGNIDIKSWSGDITVETKGTLGNAGNINLFAKNKHGALPGYKVGNVQVAADTPFRVFTDPRDLFLDTHLYGKLQGKFAWFSNGTGQPQTSSPPQISIKPLQPVQQLLQMLGVPFEFGFIQEDSGGGGCMKCISDVITQTAVDLGLFTLLPYAITEKIFIEQPELHKFNAGRNSLLDEGANEDGTNLIGGSVSILNKTSNGFGHAVDKFKLDQTYSGKDYGFGNIILNGVGSYDLHMGKNATFAADMCDWKFGVSSLIEHDWFNPSKGINPLDNILGEMNIALPGQVGQPIIKLKESIYYNQFDKGFFGDYHSKFNGLAKTGVYSLSQIKNGVFGNETAEYKVKVPYEETDNKKICQKRSIVYPMTLQPYEIQSQLYNYNIVPQTNIQNSLAQPTNTDNASWDELSGKFYSKFGDEFPSFVISGKTELLRLEQKLPNTAAATSTIISVLGALIKLIPLLGTLIGEGIQQAAKALPDLWLLDKAELYTYSPYVFKFKDTKDFSIDMPIGSHTETGIIAWPDYNPSMSGNPVLYNNIDFSLPDILPIADSMISVGTLIDPVGCLQKMVSEQLPDVVNNIECNTTVGIGGLPKIAQGLVFGAKELASANIGLFKGLKFGAAANILDSKEDKKVHYSEVYAQLPVPPDIELSIKGQSYTFFSGIRSRVQALPYIDGEITWDFLDETLAVTVGGPLVPHSVLVIGGKEIWNIPNGGGGILGSGLIDAIIDVFF